MTDVQHNGFILGAVNGDRGEADVLRERVARLEELQAERDAALREWCSAQAEWSEKMTEWCQEQSDKAEQMRELILVVGAALSPPRIAPPLPAPVPPVLTPSPDE